MKCLRNEGCGCKSCKTGRKINWKIFNTALNTTPEIARFNFNSIKGKKYPYTKEEKRNSGLKNFWAGVSLVYVYQQDEIRDFKLKQIGI